jgi:hypothetical protein
MLMTLLGFTAPALADSPVDPIALAAGAIVFASPEAISPGVDLAFKLSIVEETDSGVESIAYQVPCVLDVDGDQLKPSSRDGREGCSQLWGTRPAYQFHLTHKSAEIVLKQPARSVAPVVLRTNRKGITTEGEVPDGTPAALHDGDFWLPVEIKRGQIDTGSLSPSAMLVSRGSEGLVQWAVVAGEEEEEAPRRTREQATELSAETLNVGECPQARSEVVLCVEIEDGQFRWILNGDRDQAIPPNEVIRVLVWHRADHQVQIAMNGTLGILSPHVQDPEIGPDARGDGPQGAEVALVVTEQRFALELYDSDNALVGALAVEMIVETSYVGAIRLGVGANFLGAVDAGYEARTYPGSNQAEVAVSEGGAMDLDLMLGYAAFLGPNGRPARGCESLCLAPYVGVGVLSSSEEGLALLKSLHAGIEWEPVPDFSIAFTGVARAVDRLPEGLQVGSPIDGDTVPTQRSYGLGVGLVLNFSPAFTKLGGSL